jgi:hypothetical protein
MHWKDMIHVNLKFLNATLRVLGLALHTEGPDLTLSSLFFLLT